MFKVKFITYRNCKMQLLTSCRRTGTRGRSGNIAVVGVCKMSLGCIYGNNNNGLLRTSVTSVIFTMNINVWWFETITAAELQQHHRSCLHKVWYNVTTATESPCAASREWDDTSCERVTGQRHHLNIILIDGKTNMPSFSKSTHTEVIYGNTLQEKSSSLKII